MQRLLRFQTYRDGKTDDEINTFYVQCADNRLEYHTDETVYKAWDVAYRYEIDGEVQHENVESFEGEYDYYPAQYWVNDPEYSYPAGVINVTGIAEASGGLEEGVGTVSP